MARIYRFSAVNTLQFAEVGNVLPVDYHIKHLNSGWWFKETLRPYQDVTGYYQPVQKTDPCCFQFDSNCVNIVGHAPAATIIDSNGTEVVAFSNFGPVFTTAAVSGNTDPNTGIALTTYQYSTYAYAGLDEGIYTVKLVLPYDNGDGTYTSVTYLSEPLDVRVDHEGTIALGYSNTTNLFDTNFEQLTPRFTKRIHADLHTYTPSSTDTAYNTMGENVKILYSVPYDLFTFTVGGQGLRGVPDYELQKLNHIFSLSNFSLDGKLFTKDNGAKFERKQLDTIYPMASVSIQVRPATNSHSMYLNDNTADVYTSTTEPYAVINSVQGTMYNGVSWVDIIGNSKVVNNDSEGQTWATTLTTNRANYMLNGTFTYLDGRLRYTNGDGETWVSANPLVMSRHMDIVHTTTGTNKPLSFQTQSPTASVIDWGDSSATQKILYSGSNYTTSTHTYSTSASYTARLFYVDNNGFTAFTILNNTFNTNIDNIGGLAPSNMTSFTLFQTTLSSSFNFNFLVPCRNTLVTASLRLCGLVNNFMGNLFTGAGYMMVYCTLFDLRDNAIDVATVNSFLYNYWQRTPYSLRYFNVKMEGGTNGTPSGLGLGAKNDMNARWPSPPAVTTN